MYNYIVSAKNKLWIINAFMHVIFQTFNTPYGYNTWSTWYSVYIVVVFYRHQWNLFDGSLILCAKAISTANRICVLFLICICIMFKSSQKGYQLGSLAYDLILNHVWVLAMPLLFIHYYELYSQSSSVCIHCFHCCFRMF